MDLLRLQLIAQFCRVYLVNCCLLLGLSMWRVWIGKRYLCGGVSIAVVELCLSVIDLFLHDFCSLWKSGPQNYDWGESWGNALLIGRRRYLLRAVCAWGIVADTVAIERRSLEGVCSLRLMAGRRYVR